MKAFPIFATEHFLITQNLPPLPEPLLRTLSLSKGKMDGVRVTNVAYKKL